MRKPATAVVTGATGMIGGEVARHLASAGWKVRAIVRGSDPDGAKSRLAERLAMSPALPASASPTAVPGDPTLPLLGASDIVDLGGTSLIVHCAGATSFIDDEMCRRVNVGAARNVVETARLLDPVPRVLFLSTASVCMGPRHAVLDEDTAYGGFANGYTRSKREAERVFLESGLDAVVLRPSIVLSRGIANRAMARSILWVIPAIGEIGHAPVDPAARIDIVPVSYVAAAVAAFASLKAPAHAVYNLSAGPSACVTVGALRDAITPVFPKVGEVTFEAPRRRGAGPSRRRMRDRLARAVGFYAPFLGADVTYSCERLSAELGRRFPRCPPATEYIAELLDQVDVTEALDESQRP